MSECSDLKKAFDDSVAGAQRLAISSLIILAILSALVLHHLRESEDNRKMLEEARTKASVLSLTLLYNDAPSSECGPPSPSR
jgi:hypothetical protein